MNGLLPVIVAVLCILSLSVFLAIYLKRKLLETLFVSMVFIVLVLYLFGLTGISGSLFAGYCFILCLSVVAVIHSVRTISRKKNTALEIDLLRGLFVVFVFLILSTYLNYNRYFMAWDEFSHWGIVVKHMFSLDVLGSVSGRALLYPDYFPGTSLLQYFFTRASSSFVEYPVYIASNFMFFSILFVLINKFNLKNLVFSLAFLAAPLVVGTATGVDFYSSILVDLLIGILFGFSIVTYFYAGYSENNLFGMIVVCSSLFMLTISKDIGIVLAFLAIMVFVIDSLLYRRKDILLYLNIKNGQKRLKRTMVCVAPILIVVVSWALFKLHIKAQGTLASWNSIDLSPLLSGSLKVYQIDTIHHFWNKFFYEPYMPLPLSLFGVMLVLLGVLCLWSFFIKDRFLSRRIIVSGLVVFLGSFVYAAIILSLYLLVFSEYEAVRLSSWERYMATYLIGVTILVLSVFVYDTRFLREYYTRHKDVALTLGFIGAVLLGFLAARVTTTGGVLSSVAGARKSVGVSRTIREPYQPSIEWTSCLRNPDDKLGIIAPNTKGNERNTLLYLFHPATTHTYYRNDYSVGKKPYTEDDIWTMVIAPHDWGEYIMNNYTLVYVYEYDDLFNKSYGDYFDKLQNNQLYRVYNLDGKIKLMSISSRCTMEAL